MKIIIVGCGKAGVSLADTLNKENHDIVLIDKDGEKLQSVTDRIDVLSIEGNGASLQAQHEAGIADADLLIATTNSDELNLLCCLIAKKAGNCSTIARIRDPEYYKEARYIKEELNLSMVINPEQAAAEEIVRLIRVPAAAKIDTFARGRVELMTTVIPENSALNGMMIQDMESRLHNRVLVCVVERGNNVSIPSGRFRLKAGDTMSFIVPKRGLAFLEAAGLNVNNRISSVMIIGGGKIGYYIAKTFEESGISVKIIERDFNRCQELSELLDRAIIINGDGTDQQLLLEEGIADVDAVCTMTGLDEENIMLSLYAASIGGAKLFTKVDRITFRDIIRKMDLGCIINPTNITADSIVSYVRAMNNSMGSNVQTLYKIAGGSAEALEFNVGRKSSVTGKPLMNLHLKDNILVACINRNGRVITPNGQTIIEPGDTVIVVTTRSGLNDLEDILA